jgi:TolB-like protein
VDESLDGRGDTLKELVIGDALYGRQQPYDPRIDSTVRVEARRLRRKLAEHYESEGAGRPIRIDMPTGGYRPIFRKVSRAKLTTAPVGGTQSRSSLVDLAILPFRALSSDATDDRFADGLTDEVIFACGELPGLRVAPRIVIFQYKNRSYSLAKAADEIGAAMVLHGTIRTETGRSRVTIEIADPQGFVAWSDRVEFTPCEGIREQERLAHAIANRVPAGMAKCAARCGEIWTPAAM